MKMLYVSLSVCVATTLMASSPNLRLINGTPADAKDWPSSVYASMSGSRCSATVVGERSLLIAAHCAGNGTKASFSVGPNQYSSTCTQAPAYNGNDTADWTMCLIDKPVTGTRYEMVNTNPNRITVGTELMLTGYGCIKPGGTGGNDGIYRIGTSKVTKVPSGNSNDIVTKNGAALCYGDSGGPAFLIDKTTNDRWVVGVNSRGDISTTSYLSSVSTTVAQDFIKGWASTNNQLICGIHPNANNCRKMDCDPMPIAYAGENASIRPGDAAILGGMSIIGQTYRWTPAATLDNPNIPMPLARPNATTTYTVTASNQCGSAEKSVTITVSGAD